LENKERSMIEKLKNLWANSRFGKALAGPNRKKILWTSGILLGVVVIAAVALSLLNGGGPNLPPTTLTSGDYQTEAAQIGILADTVSSTGTVEAGQLAILSWQTTGIVEEVSVAEGEQVERGDILATLQLNSVPETVISAQADLLEAKQGLEDFYASYEGVDFAEAEQAVAEAQDAYEDALYTYNSLISPANDMAIENAYADVILAELDMREALRDYKKYDGKPDYNINRIHTFQQYYDLKLVYDAAVRTYNSLSGTGTDTQILVAQANVAVSEQAFQAAQAEYEGLLTGPSEEEIAAAEAKVAAAESVLNQRLIKAPFDGVVTLANPQIGDYVEDGENAFELQNTSSYFVTIEVNELDINQIQVGQSASVVLDAQTDVTYPAEVKKVGSIGGDSSGVVTFTVVVQILEPDDMIKSGMTAVVEIETSTGNEALLIPNQAVRIEDGQQVVYVSANGVIAPVQVTIGASSSTHSEVVAGSIQPGDLIVLNPPTTLVENPGGTFFFGNGGGPPQGGGGAFPRQP
jgi:HlyD family secretion protein